MAVIECKDWYYIKDEFEQTFQASVKNLIDFAVALRADAAYVSIYTREEPTVFTNMVKTLAPLAWSKRIQLHAIINETIFDLIPDGDEITMSKIRIDRAAVYRQSARTYAIAGQKVQQYGLGNPDDMFHDDYIGRLLDMLRDSTEDRI